jgi:hypothetical protein
VASLPPCHIAVADKAAATAATMAYDAADPVMIWRMDRSSRFFHNRSCTTARDCLFSVARRPSAMTFPRIVIPLYIFN